MNEEELNFAIFCIENVAREIGTTGDKVYRLLTVESGILDNYIIPSYNVLHTQGRGYIVDDLLELMKERGIV